MSVIRITVTISQELGEEIIGLAAKEKRKLAAMAAILLERAVRVTNNKKKANGPATPSTEQ